jgi:hypothetical protein
MLSGDYDVLGPITAGDHSPLVLQAGSVIRITTGAPLPPGADAVVQVCCKWIPSERMIIWSMIMLLLFNRMEAISCIYFKHLSITFLIIQILSSAHSLDTDRLDISQTSEPHIIKSQSILDFWNYIFDQCLKISSHPQVEDTDLLEATPDGREEKRIRVLVSVQPGNDVRPKGSDIAEVWMDSCHESSK